MRYPTSLSISTYEIKARLTEMIHAEATKIGVTTLPSDTEEIYEEIYEELVSSLIDSALGVMEQDTQWAGIVPVDVQAADLHLKLLIVRLYEKASGQNLIPFQIFPEDLPKGVNHE